MGTTLKMDIFIAVYYSFLAFPITLVLFTLFFLLATIRQGCRHGIPIWKSSSVAALVSLDGIMREELGRLGVVGDILDRAKYIGAVVMTYRMYTSHVLCAKQVVHGCQVASCISTSTMTILG
jgi:hypothetical protein